jgi:EmrB/QacA subfamily drug resistance transporter
MVLATTILASSLAFIDGSVVNVGLPAIATSLSVRGGDLSWVVNAYLLPLSALLLIGGAAGDVFGRRRLLILGVGIFITASGMCAAVPGLLMLTAGRALQGIGAAILMPNSLAILGAAFKNEDRGRAVGIWGAVGAAAGAVGPLLGGWLIDVAGWRSIFLINVPIGAASIVLAARYLDDDHVETQSSLDAPGAGLIAAALLALTWGLTVASDQKQMSLGTAGILGVRGLLLVAFLVVEQSRGEAAMMPLSLFRSASFSALTLLTLLLYGALGGLLLLVPFVLIEARGYSAIMAGAALLPLPLVIALASPLMGKLAASAGASAPLSIGAIIVAAGCVLATRIGIEGSYWTMTFPAVLTIALGMGAAVAPLTTAMLASVETKPEGVASGLNSAVARTGGLIATAAASVV